MYIKNKREMKNLTNNCSFEKKNDCCERSELVHAGILEESNLPESILFSSCFESTSASYQP